MKWLKQCILLIFILFAANNINLGLYAADISDTNGNNEIEVGFSNLNNIWNFVGNFNFKFNTDLGNFEIKNIYDGIAVEQINKNFRDSETFLLGYNYNIFNNLYAVSEFNVFLLSDKYSTNINELFRVSNLYGLCYNNDRFGDLRVLAGIENNTQVNNESVGFIFKSSGKLKDYILDNYKFNAVFSSEILSLKDNRDSKDIMVNANASHISDINYLLFSANYKLKERNFLHSIDTLRNKYAVENYKENRIAGNLNSKLQLKNFLLNIDANIENIFINRFFRESIENNKNSLITRNYNELKLYLKTSIQHITENFMQKLNVEIDYRGEDNFIKERYKISNTDFLSLQNLELQKDNVSTTLGLFYNNIWNITKNDTLLFNSSISKLEYDTPSILNNDDRDEVYILNSLNYKKRLSELLLLKVDLNLTQNHLVFIKKERSMQNNWNRILYLRTNILFDNKVLLYNPSFEVLSNYTTYDFEYLTGAGAVQSHSFRQISYKDTLQIKLSNIIALTDKMSIRYYEQGKLYWNQFAEIPQQGNLEFVASPAFAFLFDNKTISFGFRFFYLKYGQIKSGTNTELINTTKLATYSPDYSFSLKLKHIYLNCYGWLEYKYINNKYSGINPNLFLKITYIL